jgi:hypothetical protein
VDATPDIVRSARVERGTVLALGFQSRGVNHVRLSLLAFVIICSLASSSAHAQSTAHPPMLEFTLSPARAVFFAERDAEPDFGSYGLGAAIAVNLSRFIGVEGEIGGSFGGPEKLQMSTASGLKSRTPHLLDYNGNLVFSARSRSSIVPYGTAGVGALMLFAREELAQGNVQTYFVGNMGGGVKWLARNRRWGLRTDYRFLSVESKDDGPAFFGHHARYGHRVYGAVLVNLGAPTGASE